MLPQPRSAPFHHTDDPEFKDYTDIKELPTHRLAEIRRFFEDYKKNENKIVVVDEFLGREDALRIIRESQVRRGAPGWRA